MNSDDIVKDFFEFVGSDEVLNIAKLNSKAFTRKSPMDFTHIIRFMLTRGSDNTTIELDKYSNSTGIQPVTNKRILFQSNKSTP
jgi:hypothetical protein